MCYNSNNAVLGIVLVTAEKSILRNGLNCKLKPAFDQHHKFLSCLIKLISKKKRKQCNIKKSSRKSKPYKITNLFYNTGQARLSWLTRFEYSFNVKLLLWNNKSFEIEIEVGEYKHYFVGGRGWNVCNERKVWLSIFYFSCISCNHTGCK